MRLRMYTQGGTRTRMRAFVWQTYGLEEEKIIKLSPLAKKFFENNI